MLDDKELSEEITRFLNSVGATRQPQLSDMIQNILKMGHSSDYEEADLNILKTTILELRKAFRLFNPYRDHRKVTMFGSARTAETHPEFILAETTARKLTEKGFMIITGAGNGIMEAGNKGALPNMSFGVNIELPFEQLPNHYIANDPKITSFKYFFNRKLTFIKECDAVILYPGGFGTHDEAFETLTLIQTGRSAPRPIILMDTAESTYWKKWAQFVRDQLLKEHYISEEDLNLFTLCSNADEAVSIIQTFYSTYHSIRYDRGLAFMRLNHLILPEKIAELEQDFSDIMGGNKITQYMDAESSGDKHVFSHLPRLVFPFNRISFGRLTAMINAVNSPQKETLND